MVLPNGEEGRLILTDLDSRVDAGRNHSQYFTDPCYFTASPRAGSTSAYQAPAHNYLQLRRVILTQGNPGSFSGIPTSIPPP